jgi:DNA-binding NarL/FixJ family response regulator
VPQFLAEDHTLVRQGVRRILEGDPKVIVMREARTKTLKPDVLVMDISMPDLGGLEATAEILKADPQVKILILSMYSNEAYNRKAFELGVRG